MVLQLEHVHSTLVFPSVEYSNELTLYMEPAHTLFTQYSLILPANWFVAAPTQVKTADLARIG